MAIFYPYYCLRAAFSSRLNEDLYHNRWVLNSADPATDYFQKTSKKNFWQVRARFGKFEGKFWGKDSRFKILKFMYSSKFSYMSWFGEHFFRLNRGRKFDLLKILQICKYLQFFNPPPYYFGNPNNPAASHQWVTFGRRWYNFQWC